MNNPMQQANFMARGSPPPGGGPPISKKQRGGKTPGSIRSSRLSQIPRPVGGPPIGGIGGASASGGGATNNRPPPSGTSGTGGAMDDAIARRRAELRRLQEKSKMDRTAALNRNSSSSSSPHVAAAAVAHAAPHAAASHTAPIPPMRATRHNSDIYPSVQPKSPSLTKTTKNIIFDSNDNDDQKIIETFAAAANVASKSGIIVPPMTPAVGRKLEFPSSKKPAGGPPTTTAGPPIIAAPGGGGGTTTVRRARSRSPTSSSSSNNDTTTKAKAKAAAALAQRRNRAKSAPRPPPPTGPRPTTQAGSAGSAGTAAAVGAAIAAKKKVKARRPIPVTATDAITKSTTTVVEDTSTDVGIGTMNTSNIPPTATKTKTTTAIAETPIAQKSYMDNNDNDGQKTPPSTGSSARRQKLQLMREQAGAGASVTATASSAPATAAFAAAISGSGSVGGGPPATAAFAAAISGNGATTTKGTGNTTSSSSFHATALPPPGKIAGVTSSSVDVVPPLRSESLSQSQSRLEEAYTKSEHDKTAALIKIKMLEDALNQKTKEDLNRAKQNKPGSIGANNIVEQLIQMAEMNGPEAALDWAKSQNGNLLPGSPTRPASRVGFNTGMGVGTPMKSSSGSGSGYDMGGGIHTPTRRRIASRNLTPHPTKKQQRGSNGNGEDTSLNNQLIPDNEKPEETERRLIRQFREATQYVPYEFSSELASYTVRRPYGIDGIIDGNIDDNNSKNSAELFDYVKPPEEPFEEYSRRAHVSSKSSIEVVAIIKADNLPFLLFDTAGVRYKANPNNEEWIHINNVDTDLDRPLGHITYVDEHAMEREYSLDEILEEALLVREQYCGTLTSTALGLDGRGPQQQQQQQQAPVQQVEIPDLQKVSSRDVGVETDEKGIATDGSSPQQQAQAQAQHTPNVEKEEESGGGSSDVLIVFFGMMFTLFYNFLFGFFIGMPLRIIRTIFVLTISYIIIQMLHMHFADGYNEWVLNLYDGATTTASYTMNDLVYYTNRQPGIM